MNIIDEIRKTAKGAAILLDWLGEGMTPVEEGTAYRRAIVCVCCPENTAERWWEKARGKIAAAIRVHLALKNKMKLRVDLEEKLQMCRVCGCANPLAIWTPIERIKEHTTAEQLKAFPSYCWKVREIEGMK